MFLELFSLATFRNWLDNEIGILIFVSEEEIEEGDSIIFSWSDTVAKIKFQYHPKVMRASKRYKIAQLMSFPRQSPPFDHGKSLMITEFQSGFLYLFETHLTV